MIETEVKEIDDLKFHIQQFPAMMAMKLEKRTLTILHPLVKILKDSKGLDSELGLGSLAEVVGDVLTNLDDATFESYIFDMLRGCSVEIKNPEGKGTKPQLLSDSNIFNGVFAGKNITVYKLLIEVMKVNHFAFFELLGGGEKVMGILSNQIQKVNP